VTAETRALLNFRGLRADLTGRLPNLAGIIWYIIGKVHDAIEEEITQSTDQGQHQQHGNEGSGSARRVVIQYQFEKINQAEYSDDRNHNLGDGAGLDRGMKDFLFFFFLSTRGPLAVFLLYGQTYRVTIRRLGTGHPLHPIESLRFA